MIKKITDDNNSSFRRRDQRSNTQIPLSYKKNNQKKGCLKFKFNDSMKL